MDDKYLLVLKDTEENKHLKGKKLTVVLSKYLEEDGVIVKDILNDGLHFTPPKIPVTTSHFILPNEVLAIPQSLLTSEIQKAASGMAKQMQDDFDKRALKELKNDH